MPHTPPTALPSLALRKACAVAATTLALLASSCAKEAQAPRILSVEPASGRDDRQTLILIRGEHLDGRLLVSYDDQPSRLDASFTARLGDVALQHVALVGLGALRAVVPSALPAGPHELTIVDAAGRSAALPAAFTVLRTGDGGTAGEAAPSDGRSAH